MIARALRAPGLAFEAVRPPPEPAPLRSDIAAFVCATRRGPVGVPVRVEGWREYCGEFGGLDFDLDATYAIRGYFENGGEVAWIIRLAPGATVSRASKGLDVLSSIYGTAITVEAASPGDWSKQARVKVTYRGRTTSGIATVDVDVRTSDEHEEHRALRAGALEDLVERINTGSRLIRFVTSVSVTKLTRGFAFDETVLDIGGTEARPAQGDYLAGVDQLDDIPEAALISLPDLHTTLLDDVATTEVYRFAAKRAEVLRDRMLLVELPPVSAAQRRWHVDGILRFLDDTLERRDDDETETVRWWRAAALYHPWIRVPDPLGGVARPTRDIAPSGHVAGVISQLDRDRGAHSTPANAPTVGVLDLVEEYDNDEHAILNNQGVDLLRCVPAVGFSIWGGRTLDRTARSKFVAHRRLIHRLVRAIRRVAEPLVFETNGPALWFAFVRAITAVLLEAWRAGSLVGGRPAEAFNVICDETTNSPEEVDVGRCVCTIELAPAIPMEFILVRVALSRDGSLEVLS